MNQMHADVKKLEDNLTAYRYEKNGDELSGDDQLWCNRLFSRGVCN